MRNISTLSQTFWSLELYFYHRQLCITLQCNDFYFHLRKVPQFPIETKSFKKTTRPSGKCRIHQNSLISTPSQYKLLQTLRYTVAHNHIGHIRGVHPFLNLTTSVICSLTNHTWKQKIHFNCEVAVICWALDRNNPDKTSLKRRKDCILYDSFLVPVSIEELKKKKKKKKKLAKITKLVKFRLLLTVFSIFQHLNFSGSVPLQMAHNPYDRICLNSMELQFTVRLLLPGSHKQ